jgi:DNA-binding transcriptional LysR family regulator
MPGARRAGTVGGKELRRTPLVLGDGLRAAMDALLAGRGIELKVDTEVNDHETMRLMVQRGAAASVLPYSSVARECERGLLEAHRLTESGVFRTLALGVRAGRSASPAREAVMRAMTRLVAGMESAGRLSLVADQTAPLRRAKRESVGVSRGA